MLQISFHSDLGEKNYIHSIAKSLLESQIDQAKVTDVFNRSKHNTDLEEYAYNMLASIHYFPPQSVHIFFSQFFSIDSTIVITKIKDQYVILPNNGIVSIIDYLDYTSKKYIVQVEKPEQLNWVQFTIMVMAEICNSIQKNTALDEIGTFTNNYKLSFPLSNGLQINDNYIFYRIIYIDSYSNAVTNLHIDDFREHVGNKPFKTSLMGKYMIEKVSKNYQDVDESSYVGGIFNDLGFFEIFLSIGELCSQLKITKKSAIKLKLEY